MPGLEQALLAIRGEIEFLDTHIARLKGDRTRLIAALDLLEGPADVGEKIPADIPAAIRPASEELAGEARDLVVEDAGDREDPDGGTDDAGLPSSAITTLTTHPDADDLADLLDHPDRIESAVQVKGSTGWVRADGRPWECSCGKKIRTLSYLRQHLTTVVNPKAHRPLITRAATYVEGLAFGCSCFARFATAKEWSEHRNAKPTIERNRHRLVDQPKSEMVPTGLPAPRPAVAPLSPAVAALQDREKVYAHRETVGEML